MSVESEPSKPLDLADIKKGDPIRRQFLLQKVTPAQLVAGFEGAAIGASITPNLRYFGDGLLTLPAYSMGAMALAAGTVAGIRYTDKRRAEKAEKQQTAIRDAIDEPVDVYTSGRGSKKEAHLRWYGADRQTALTAFETATRYKEVVAFAKANGMSSVSVDADWVHQSLGYPADTPVEETLAEYGRVEYGPSLMSDENSAVVTAYDEKSAEMVLISEIDTCAELAEVLQGKSQDILISELISRTNDAELQNQLDILKGDETRSFSALTQLARHRLETVLNQDSTGIMRGYDAQRNPVRERMNYFQEVRGDFVHQTGVPVSHSGPTRTSYEISPILDTFGASSLQELVTKALEKEHSEGEHDELIAAIYLLAYANDETRHDAISAASAVSPRSLFGKTLFERAADEQPRMNRFAESRAYKKNPESVSIGYENRKGVRRGLMVLGTLAIAAGALYGANAGIQQVYGETYSEQVDYCEDEGIDDILDYDFGAESSADSNIDREAAWEKYHQACDAAYLKYNQLSGIINTVFNTKDEVEWAIQKGTAEAVISVAGPNLIGAIAPYTVSIVSENWASDALTEPPASIYTESGESFIGDANSNSNKVIYSIDSLDGSPTDGYWYTDSYDQLNTAGTGIVFYTNHKNIETSFAGEGLTVDELDASSALRVSTPFISPNKYTNIAVKDGYALSGLRIIDGNDPTKVYTPTANGVVQEGTDILKMSLNAEDKWGLQRAGIDAPVLTYWLSPVQSNDYYSNSLNFPYQTSNESADSEKTATNALGTEVKKSFGLSKDATPEEIVQAIQFKGYSYTPLKDAGIDTLSRPADAYTQMAEIGGSIARLNALNCNLASAAFLLATAGDGGEYNQATGFRNGDGNNELSQLEAHAWIVDGQSEIIDPTPSGINDFETPPAEKSEDAPQPINSPSLPTIGITTATGIGAYVAWRQRRRIAAAADKLHTQIAFKTPLASKALTIMEHAHYGRPGQEVDWAVVNSPSSPRSVERLARLPDDAHTVAKALKNTSLKPADKRAVKKLQRSKAAAKRTTKK